MTPTPVVSIIVPTLNRRTLLALAVESIQAQSFANWELLIVDDRSTDGTAPYVSGIGDSRVHLISRTDIRGIASARNEGAQRARGAWLAFLDSDDVWKPHKLATQLAALEREGREWTFSDVDTVDEQGGLLDRRSHVASVGCGDVLGTLLTTQVGASISTLVVSARLFGELGGFDPDPALPEDYDLVLRLAAGHEPVVVREALASIRIHGARRVNDDQYMMFALAYRRFLGRGGSRRHRRLAHRMRSGH
ncbi:MAG: glycosyltransferase family 2 protein, partial [Acidobacteria bacterium]|nr:glycosyltransferase family 2 protein [Acidobacteriota bacterium]